MSSLNLAINPSNNLQGIKVDSNGNLKVDVSASSSSHTQNVDVVANTVGLATAANQVSGNASLATLAGAVAGGEVQVDVITSALPSGAATEATLAAAEAHLGNIDTATSSIQSNVATSALQTAGNSILTDAEAHLGTIDTSTATASTTLTGISAKLPATLGQDVMADSLSVVIASNQSSIPVSTAGGSTTNSIDNLTPTAGATATSTAADMNGSNHLTIFGNSNNTTDQIFVETSADNSTFYKNPNHFVNQNFSTGDFAVNIVSPAARYYRISQGNTTGSGKTLAINTSKK